MAKGQPEQQLQIALVTLLRTALPAGWRVFATKNHGEQKTRRMHGVHKAMGVMSGLPDLTVLGPGPRILLVELKAPPKRLPSGKLSAAKMKTSDNQDDVIAWLRGIEIPVLVANDIDVVLAWLRGHGVPLRVR